MQAVGFVSGQNFLIRHKDWGDLLPSSDSGISARDVLGVGFLEETTLVSDLSFRVVVFDSEPTMPQR